MQWWPLERLEDFLMSGGLSWHLYHLLVIHSKLNRSTDINWLHMRFVKNATAAMNKATFTCGSQATYIVSHHFYLYIFERIQYRGSPISYIYSLAYIDLYIYTNHISYVYLSTCTWTPCAQNCPGVHRPAQWKLRLGEYLSKWTGCTALHLATATVRNAKKYEKKDTDLVGAPVKKEKKEKREKEKREKKSKSSKRKTGEAEAETKTPTRKSKKSKTNWFLGWYMLIFFDLGDGLPTNSNRHLLEYQQLYLRVTRGNLQHPVMKFNRIALAGYVYFSGPSPCPCQNAQPLVNMCSWCNIYIWMYISYI